MFSDEYGFDEVEDPWTVPTVTGGQLVECKSHLAALERYLEPAPAPKTVARVAALLSHYFVPDSKPELQRAVAHDWIDTIGEYPWWAIEDACRKWMRMERRRPTPADIRDLCQRAVKAEAQQRDRLRKIVAHNDDRPTGPTEGNVYQMPRMRRVTE